MPNIDKRALTSRLPILAILAILRRHLTVGLLTTATLLAGAILTAVVAHVITD